MSEAEDSEPPLMVLQIQDANEEAGEDDLKPQDQGGGRRRDDAQ